MTKVDQKLAKTEPPMTTQPTRLQWAPYPDLPSGLRARHGPLYCDIWASGTSGQRVVHWSVYAVLGPLGWCWRDGIASSRQEAADAANLATSVVMAELGERFPEWLAQWEAEADKKKPA